MDQTREIKEEKRKGAFMRDKNILSLFEWIVMNQKEAELQDAEKKKWS